MRLKNKKTGEIVDTLCSDDITKGISFGIDHHDGNPTMAYYNSLAELNAEWCDYEEPKEWWYIDIHGPHKVTNNDEYYQQVKAASKEIGNYFETRTEAELAVRKLKAWKRLKDKGFRFDHIRSVDGVSINHKDLDQYTIIAYADEDGCDQECLDLLFSGGEE